MNYQKASFWRRFAAALIDGVIVVISGGIVGVIIGLTGVKSASVSNGLSMIISIAYYLATYMNLKGRTLGKKVLNIQVIKKDGTPMTDPFTIIVRDIVGKFISAIVFLLGYIWMLFDKNNQTWHDKIAGTYVIYTESSEPTTMPQQPVQQAETTTPVNNGVTSEQPNNMVTEQNHEPESTPQPSQNATEQNHEPESTPQPM